VSFTIWLENTRRTVRGARRNQSRSPIRAIRSSWLSCEAIEDRIALSGLTAFVDPDPSPGNDFGATVVTLSTGNVVVTSPNDNAGGSGAGAVYLFNGTTGALISTLTGSHAGKRQLRGGQPQLDQRRGHRCRRGHVGQRHGRCQRRRQCRQQPGRKYGG
jgi:hypothetical protein